MCIFDICKELLLISKVKGRPYLESMLRYSDVRMLVSNCCCCRIWCFCLLILSNVCCKIKKWHCLWKITALEHAIDPCIQRWLENYLFLFWRCDPSKFANSPYFQCPSSLNSSSSSYVEASATSKNWQGTRHKIPLENIDVLQSHSDEVLFERVRRQWANAAQKACLSDD